jgi:hypothetical protein
LTLALGGVGQTPDDAGEPLPEIRSIAERIELLRERIRSVESEEHRESDLTRIGQWVNWPNWNNWGNWPNWRNYWPNW